MTQSELLLTLRELQFTKTERRVLSILCDGRPHDMESVRQTAYPNDDQATNKNLLEHITNLRNKLRDIGHTILSEYVKGVMYYKYVVFECITPDEKFERYHNGRLE